jgi:hypothetical protein
MESTSQLDVEFLRKLALRLFGEQQLKKQWREYDLLHTPSQNDWRWAYENGSYYYPKLLRRVIERFTRLFDAPSINTLLQGLDGLFAVFGIAAHVATEEE